MGEVHRTWTVAALESASVLRVEDGNHGEYRPRPTEFVPGGTPYIRAADMSSGTVDFVGAEGVSREALARIRKGIGQDRDTLLSHKGTVGKVAYVPPGSPPFVCSPQTTFWRSLDHQKLDPVYLNLVVRSQAFQAQLDIMKSSTDMAPYVSLTQQRSLIIDLPPIDDQRAIADVLGALDDKIAANARLVGAADALASASYGSMLRGACTELPLTALAEFVNGRAFTKDASGTGRVVVRIAELNSGIGGSTVFSDAEVADQYLARPGDVLFAWSGSLTLHRWFRPEAIVNQHIFKVVPLPGWPAWLVWQAIASQLGYFRGVAADKATTMGHIQRRHLDEAVAVPVRAAIDRSDALMTSLWDRALAAERENLTLSTTRDALLPALMSGRLRVREAERLAEKLT